MKGRGERGRGEDRGEGQGRGERIWAGEGGEETGRALAGEMGRGGGERLGGMVSRGGEGVWQGDGRGLRAGQPPVPAGRSFRSGLMFKIVIQGNVPRVERAELVPGRAPRAPSPSPRKLTHTARPRHRPAGPGDPKGADPSLQGQRSTRKSERSGYTGPNQPRAGQHGLSFCEHVGETRREPSTHTPGERPSRVGGRNTGFNGWPSREFDRRARAKVFGGELRPRCRLCRPRRLHSNGSSVPVWTYTQARVHAYTGPPQMSTRVCPPSARAETQRDSPSALTGPPDPRVRPAHGPRATSAGPRGP